MICCYDNNDISKWSQIYIYSNPVNDRICVVCFLDNYDKVGCYRDGNNPRAITSLEGTDTTLDGHYKSRKNAIGKCVVAAIRAGHSMFALQDGGWCAASATAHSTFDKYGKSTSCKADGEGGIWSNQVYTIKGE